MHTSNDWRPSLFSHWREQMEGPSLHMACQSVTGTWNTTLGAEASLRFWSTLQNADPRAAQCRLEPVAPAILCVTKQARRVTCTPPTHEHFTHCCSARIKQHSDVPRCACYALQCQAAHTYFRAAGCRKLSCSGLNASAVSAAWLQTRMPATIAGTSTSLQLFQSTGFIFGQLSTLRGHLSPILHLAQAGTPAKGLQPECTGPQTDTPH
jgi:hypothetical protein